MANADNSSNGDEPLSAGSHIQALQDTWLLTLFAVVLVICLPWFSRAFEIDFVSASWMLLLLGATYVAMSLVASAKPLVTAMRRRILGLLHAVAIVLMGCLWQRAGGLQNPAFLLAFMLPVLGATALSRWQPYASAALAVLIVSYFTVSQAPELRWYTAGLPVTLQSLMGWLGTNAPTAHSAFPGFYAPVGYAVVLLEVFTILIFGCAIAAESLGTSFERLVNHLTGARGEAARSQGLWETLLQQLPAPALLVNAETLQIVSMSDQLAAFMGTDATRLGQGLFEAIPFSYPERVEEIIGKEAGAVMAVVLRIANEIRIVNVRVQRLRYEGQPLALVLLEDASATFCTAAALDAEQHPIVVISSSGRIVATNKSARVLFPGAELGSEAARALAAMGAGARGWWEPGLTGRRRVHLTLGQHAYLASCAAVPVPGESEALYVVRFAPLLPAAVGAQHIASVPR
jgi:PAS domain-containing protein